VAPNNNTNYVQVQLPLKNKEVLNYKIMLHYIWGFEVRLDIWIPVFSEELKWNQNEGRSTIYLTKNRPRTQENSDRTNEHKNMLEWRLSRSKSNNDNEVDRKISQWHWNSQWRFL